MSCWRSSFLSFGFSFDSKSLGANEATTALIGFSLGFSRGLSLLLSDGRRFESGATEVEMGTEETGAAEVTGVEVIEVTGTEGTATDRFS